MQHVNEGRTYASRDARKVADGYQKHGRTASDGAARPASSSAYNGIGAGHSIHRNQSIDDTRTQPRHYELEPGEVLEDRREDTRTRADSPPHNLGRTYPEARSQFSRPPSLPPRPNVAVPGGSPSPPPARPAARADLRTYAAASLERSLPASSRPLPTAPLSPPRGRSASAGPFNGFKEIYGEELPKGILKPNGTAPASDPASAINGKGSSSGSMPGRGGIVNCLAGQKVNVGGMVKGIKPYTKTIEQLRIHGPHTEAFEDKAASTYEASSAAGSLKQPTCLEVYLPVRAAKLETHDPANCMGLCRGSPHPDVGPVCRFCRNLTEPRKRSEVAII